MLVTFVPEGAAPDARLDPATGGALASLLGGTELRRKAFEIAWLPVVARGAKASRVLVVGSGRTADVTPERWRRLGIVAGLAVRQRRFGRLACLVPDADARPDVVQALAEGLLYAAIDLDTYKTSDRDTTPLTEALIRVETPAPELVAAVARGRVLGEATNFARLMANEPGERADAAGVRRTRRGPRRRHALDVQIHDEHAIEALGMG